MVDIIICACITNHVYANIIIEFGLWSDNTSKKDVMNKEDRAKLGLAPLPKGRSAPTTPPNESDNAYQKIDVCVVFSLLYLNYLLCLWNISL